MRSMRLIWAGAGLAVLSLGTLAAQSQPTSEQAEFFEKSVRPVLVDRCLKCHGPEKQKGGLRLDSRTALLKGGEGGSVVTEGKPDESRLIAAIRYQGETQMPPYGVLPADQVKALERWVKLGLPWPGDGTLKGRSRPEAVAGGKTWWSFQPIKLPTPPNVRDKTWPRSPIDQFILARLEKESLSPARPADKAVLLRRATFDLIGLPPTPAEVATFVNDPAPDAYSKLIDRLLGSPHYGERWARHWLDLVRYTDSFDARILSGAGREMDATEAWRYRDWVVRALNDDLPYDRFVIEQIAGDRLAEADGRFDANKIIATGMLAIGNWGGGDADKEKLLTDIADDQVDVVGRAFLGLTLACARCHDHKFDPISTEDYYGLAGVFFSSHILRDPGPKTNGPPMLQIPLAGKAELERRRQREVMVAELEKLAGAMTARVQKQAVELNRRETAHYLKAVAEFDRASKANGTSALTPFASQRHLDPTLFIAWLEFIRVTSRERHLSLPTANVMMRAGLHAWRGGADTPSLLVNTTTTEQSLGTLRAPPRSVSIHPSPMGGVAVAWRAPVTTKVRLRGLVADADDVCGDGVAWRLELRHGDAVRQIVTGEIPNGGREEYGKSIDAINVEVGDEVRLVILPKKDYTCDTTRIELLVEEVVGKHQTWSLEKELQDEPLRANPRADTYGNADVWHFLDVAPPALSAAVVKTPAMVAWRKATASTDVADGQTAERAAERFQQALEADDITTGPNGPLWQALSAPSGPLGQRVPDERLPVMDRVCLFSLRSALDYLQRNKPANLPMANGCLEGGCPESAQAGTHDVRVHVRGRYDRLGSLVPRRVPTVLGGAGQLAIAPDSSGRLELARWIASPNNPLTARVIVNRIWQHHFGQGLVRTPSNFGKLGEAPTHPELLDYLASEFKRHGWSLKWLHREIMLTAAYQQSSRGSEEALKGDPENRLISRMARRRLDAELLRDSLLAASGDLDPVRGGPAVADLNSHRRTLYLQTVRSDRTTFRELFDAADPTAIVDARNESTVAPQALFLLNHALVRAQAKAVAVRVLREQSGDPGQRVERLYLCLYGRRPQEREVKLAMEMLKEGQADLQAWAELAHLLICGSEFLYLD